MAESVLAYAARGGRHDRTQCAASQGNGFGHPILFASRNDFLAFRSEHLHGKLSLIRSPSMALDRQALPSQTSNLRICVVRS